MSGLSRFQVFAAGLQLVPALVLAVLGWEGQRETRSVDRPGALPRHLPHPAILLAAYYLLAAASGSFRPRSTSRVAPLCSRPTR